MPVRAETDVRTGVLLAGGSARRAGVDKRYLVLGGETLLARNLRFLRDLFPEVVVSLGAGQDLDLGDAGPAMLLPDEYPGASPLAGIATALRRLGRPVFVLAADLAFPVPGAAARVLAAFPGHDAALPRIGRLREPLFAAYGPACLPPMEALLLSGRHRIAEAFPALRVAHVAFPDDRPFHNINTMDAYQEARRRAIADAPAQAHDPAGETVSPRDEGAGALPALVAVVGKSDSGKTTLIERLLPELSALGLTVGTVKHDAHGFDIDHPGKDSWRHGQAGARAYAVASPDRLAFVTRLDDELPLAIIARRFFAGFDLVVAEGYKRTAPNRVEVFRVGAGHEEPLCAPGEALALVTDAPLAHEHRFALDDARGLARFLAARLATLRRY
jgi:molybdopterin-guanine dinucleotide biosynthesis protein B/molybdopterin-guanine dinucleotide biosynthesis protein